VPRALVTGAERIAASARKFNISTQVPYCDLICGSDFLVRRVMKQVCTADYHPVVIEDVLAKVDLYRIPKFSFALGDYQSAWVVQALSD
jgi:hypothetical protein